MKLSWSKHTSDNLDEALAKCFCLYVFYDPTQGKGAFYIGKAKYFGTKQEKGYTASARYNSGYVHLIEGLLSTGFELYISEIGEQEFENAEGYEQELIHLWSPTRKQKLKPEIRKPVQSPLPWLK